jgi:hypothetical protein
MFEFNRIQLYSGSGLDRIQLYSVSGLDSIQLYSGSGLDRIYLTLCILYFYPFYPLTNEVAKGYSNTTYTRLGQNQLKDVDSRVFTRMLHGKKFTRDFDL